MLVDWILFEERKKEREDNSDDTVNTCTHLMANSTAFNNELQDITNVDMYR